jgi:isoleucyl-tRNA synthetase
MRLKIRQPDKIYSPLDVEKNVSDFWSKTQAYNRTKLAKKDCEKFYFVDGPPYTTGSIHLGTAWNKVMKDTIIRYKRLRGFDVRDQPGFDMHGLPIEVKVEQSLGIKNKKEIESLGMEKFITTCKDYAINYQQKMTEQFKALGIWMDWDNPSLSIRNSYIESAWWSIKRAHSNDLLKKAMNVISWCPRCETALASAEIEYSEITDPSIYLKIPLKGRRDEYLIIWTTTPWTLTANLAIAVHPDFNYARMKIRIGNRKETIIVLEEKVEEIVKIAKIEAYEIVETVKGEKLEGLQYFHPLMADIPFQKEAAGDWVHKVVSSDSVAAEHTGCVHVSPGFGVEDFMIGMKFKLPIFSPVDERGVFTTQAGMKYAGQGVREANETVLADLRNMRFIFHETEESHRYGHCWRCKTPLIYRATEQWFLKVSAVREQLLKAVEKITWMPDWIGSSRFFDWVSNARDWCISRQRYWGIPMPVWECLTDVCGHVEVIGSTKELEKSTNYTPDMDLHRPWVDKVSLDCPKCGGRMRRVPDTIDVWFDSGICAWAQLEFPMKKKAFSRWWPCDWITESHDQTRGWFYTQLCASLMVQGNIPFKSVLVHGWMCDHEGKPLSKSSEEYVEPNEVIKKFGVDALRLYMLGHSAPWNDIAFNMEDVKAAHRTLRILWNCYIFSASYMRMDNFDPFAKDYERMKPDFRPEDNWLLSKADTLAEDVKKHLDAFRFDKACASIEDFILSDLSRCYIKIVRDRLWSEENTPDKDAAYKTLQEALTRVALVSSPIMPFISEHIYQALDGRNLTVHMGAWPESQAGRVNKSLEKAMITVKQVVCNAMKLRQKHYLKLRWPVKKLIVTCTTSETYDAVKTFEEVIKSLVNLKQIEIVPPGKEWAGQELEVIPNPNVIGKAYKQWESKVARMLKVLPAKEVKDKIQKGEYHLGIEGQDIKILPDMVSFRTKLPKNVITEDFDDGQIFLETGQEDALLAEGYSREIVRRIQDMRKDMEMDTEEFVKVSMSITDNLASIIDSHLEHIADDTRANQIELVDDVEGDYIVEWSILDEPVVLGLTAMDMSEFAKIPGIDKKLAMALVDAGVTESIIFTDSEKDFLMQIPGMTNTKLRKLREFYESPEAKRAKMTEDQRCPTCDGVIDSSSASCQRCGKRVAMDGLPEFEEPDWVQKGKQLAQRLLEDEEPMEEEGSEEDLLLEKPVLEDDAAPRKGRQKSKAREAVEKEETLKASEKIAEQILLEAEEPGKPIPQQPAEKKQVRETPEVIMVDQQMFEGEQKEKKTAEPEDMPASEEEKPGPQKEEPPEKSVTAEDLGPEEEPEIQLVTEKEAVWTRIIESARESKEKPTEGPDAIKKPAHEEKVSESEIKEVPSEEEGKKEGEKEATDEEFAGTETEERVDKSEIIGGGRDKGIAVLTDALEINPSTAKLLYSGGYQTLESLQGVTEEQLRSIKGIGKVTARKILDKVSTEQTQMCTLCNAIVPADVKECPRCGVRFSPEESVTHETEKQMSTLSLLDKKLKRKPDDVNLLYSKAMTLKDADNTKEALAIIEKALLINPDDKRLLEVKQALSPKPEGTKEKEKVSASEQEAEPGDREQSGSRIMSLIGALSGEEEIKVELKQSFTYLIPEERSEESYFLLKKMINTGMAGFCVTRTYPDKVREKYQLGATPILWLSNVAKEDTVRPKDLEKLSLSLEEFLTRKGGVVLLDGIEYLITNNNFITVLKLIQSLRDLVAINRSILLLSVNPSTLETPQINLLRREVDVVIEINA